MNQATRWLLPKNLDYLQFVEKKPAEPYATMSLNEVPYREDTKYEPNVVVPSCCPDAAVFKNFGDVKVCSDRFET